MNDAHPVRGGERVDDLPRARHCLVEGQGAEVSQAIAQALALEQLHHEIDDAVVGVAEVGDVDDVGVADLVDGLGLLEEARHQARIGAQVRAQHLDGHPLADHRMLGEVDGTHATFAENADDLVVTDAATDHEWQRLYPDWRHSADPRSRRRWRWALEPHAIGRIVFASW